MATTLATALIETRARLDEADGLGATTNVAWLDSELRRWINEGCVDITRRTHCLTDRTTIAVTGGTAEYTGPVNTLAIDIVNYTPTGGSKAPIQYQHITNANAVQFISQSSYIPYWWTIRNMPPNLKIILTPTPSTNGQLEVIYTRVAAKLATDGTADASNMEIPDGWEDLVYEYAEIRALRKDRDPRWQEAQSSYTDKINSLMEIAGVYTHNAGQIVSAQSSTPWYLDW
jgi:hypothetical protein